MPLYAASFDRAEKARGAARQLEARFGIATCALIEPGESALMAADQAVLEGALRREGRPRYLATLAAGHTILSFEVQAADAWKVVGAMQEEGGVFYDDFVDFSSTTRLSWWVARSTHDEPALEVCVTRGPDWIAPALGHRIARGLL